MDMNLRGLIGSVVLTVAFVAGAADLPVPAEYPGDPETLADVARVELPSRTEISLNGLWRSRPIVDEEPEDKVPSDDWGWAKIPGFLSREGVGNFLEDQETFFAPRFAEMIKSSRDFAKTVNERRWYRRTFTMPKEAEGHRVRLRFAADSRVMLRSLWSRWVRAPLSRGVNSPT